MPAGSVLPVISRAENFIAFNYLAARDCVMFFWLMFRGPDTFLG
jgi:hypothetical protein